MSGVGVGRLELVDFDTVADIDGFVLAGIASCYLDIISSERAKFARTIVPAGNIGVASVGADPTSVFVRGSAIGGSPVLGNSPSGSGSGKRIDVIGSIDALHG